MCELSRFFPSSCCEIRAIYCHGHYLCRSFITFEQSLGIINVLMTSFACQYVGYVTTYSTVLCKSLEPCLISLCFAS